PEVLADALRVCFVRGDSGLAGIEEDERLALDKALDLLRQEELLSLQNESALIRVLVVEVRVTREVNDVVRPGEKRLIHLLAGCLIAVEQIDLDLLTRLLPPLLQLVPDPLDLLARRREVAQRVCVDEQKAKLLFLR